MRNTDDVRGCIPAVMSRRSFLQVAALGGGLTGSVRAAEPGVEAARFLREWGRIGTEPGEFHFPIGLAINPADEVFVTDFYNARVQKFSPGGKLLAFFSVPPNPGAITLDVAGDLYITHFSAMRVKEERKPDKITVHSPAGKFLREWGKTGTANGEFDYPGGLAIDREGRVYVADQTNHRIQVFDRRGRFLLKWGEYGNGVGQFGGKGSRNSRTGGPQFVALDSAGNIWTTEGANGRVQKFTSEGKPLLAWGDNADRPGSFGGVFTGFKDRKASLQGPVGICIDRQNRVWVSAVCGRIQQFTAEGKLLRCFGGAGTEPGQFYAPHSLALDSQGHLYLADSFNHRIQKFAV